MIARMYSIAGGATGYVLAVVDLEPGSRRIRWYLPLAQPQRNIETPERIWEFVRHYMDGDPETLPPIDFLPPLDDPKADLARMDRFLYGDMVDENHRVSGGLFSWLYVGLIGGFMYWFERAGLWISRTAPRPELPPELKAIMQAQPGTNPYKVSPPTEAQRLASEGKLPHLKRRWFVLACFCTVVMFLVFAALGIAPWFEN